jgi:MFS family permease
LRTPAFRRLWTAGVVTVVGAQLTVVAVPFQLYELTGSSAWVGLTGLFGLVPLIVFGLWGGAIADAVDRRMLLVVSGVGIAVTSALLGITAVTHIGGPWTVLVIFAVQTACLAVNQPTRSAVLPRILPLDQLPAANTLWFTVQQLGAFAGPLVGGVALAFIDVGVLYFVDTVCLFASIWAAYRLPRLPVGDDAESGFRGVVRAIRSSAGLRSVVDGFRYAAMSKVLLVSFLADLVAMASACRARCSRRRRSRPTAVARRTACSRPRSPAAPRWAGCSRGGCTASPARASRSRSRCASGVSASRCPG